MTGPTITFGFILATLYGAFFHLLMGGDARRLALFLLAGWFGFAVGHMLGAALQIDLFSVGTLRVFAATMGAFVTLIAATIVSSNRFRKSLTR